MEKTRIVARCTKEEKEKIIKQSKNNGYRILSKYIIDIGTQGNEDLKALHELENGKVQRKIDFLKQIRPLNNNINQIVKKLHSLNIFTQNDNDKLKFQLIEVRKLIMELLK